MEILANWWMKNKTNSDLVTQIRLGWIITLAAWSYTTNKRSTKLDFPRKGLTPIPPNSRMNPLP